MVSVLPQSFVTSHIVWPLENSTHERMRVWQSNNFIRLDFFYPVAPGRGLGTFSGPWNTHVELWNSMRAEDFTGDSYLALICSLKKPTKGPILYDFHLNEVPRPVQSIETESRMQVAKSRGELVFRGDSVSLAGWKRCWRRLVVMVAQQWMCRMPQNWTLETGYNGKFYVYFTPIQPPWI